MIWIKLTVSAVGSAILAILVVIAIAIIAVIRLPIDLIYALCYWIKSRIELARKLKEVRRQAEITKASFRRWGEERAKIGVKEGDQ